MFGLNETEKDRLRAFERGLYTVEIADVEVELAEESVLTLAADVYVWKGRRDELVGVEERVWNVEDFL